MIPRSAAFGWAGRRLALSLPVAAMLLVPISAQAVMPMSPQLDPASRLALVSALAGAGIPETGSSAVLNSLLAVLSSGPAARRHRYRQPYPQLPDVDASAAVAGRGCAAVRLTVRPKMNSRRPVAIRGTYCLADPARYIWSARALSVGGR